MTLDYCATFSSVDYSNRLKSFNRKMFTNNSDKENNLTPSQSCLKKKKWVQKKSGLSQPTNIITLRFFLFQGMLSIFWRQWLDFEGVFYQGSPFWCSLDTHKLPVLTCNKENKHYGRLRALLLQQSFCVLALMDRSQGQVHGSEGKSLIIVFLPHSCQSKPAHWLAQLHALDHKPKLLTTFLLICSRKGARQRSRFLVCLANLLACKPYQTSIH